MSENTEFIDLMIGLVDQTQGSRGQVFHLEGALV